MPKRLFISQEQIKELESLRKRNQNKNVEKRIKALLLYAAGEKREKIAETTGFATTYVSELVSRYCRRGDAVIKGENYGGNHRNLTFEEEEALLAPFRQELEEGRTVKISEIKQAYENAIGRSLDKSHGQIYYVLHRHNWPRGAARGKRPSKPRGKTAKG